MNGATLPARPRRRADACRACARARFHPGRRPARVDVAVAGAIEVDTIAPLLHDPRRSVSDEALDALVELGTAEAIAALLRWAATLDDDRRPYAIWNMIGLERGRVSDVCRDDVYGAGCAELLDAIDSGKQVGFLDTGAIHASIYSLAHVHARQVWPRRGRKARGWSDDLGDVEPVSLRRGDYVWIDRDLLGEDVSTDAVAVFDGETWLRVRAGPYGGNLWLHEADTRRIDPAALADEPLDFGARTVGIRVRDREPRE